MATVPVNPAASLHAALTATAKSDGRKFAVLTAYDYPGARLLEEAGVDWVLVGDSLGMVVLGYPDTTHVTLGDMLHHTAAAARGLTRTPLIADLPIGTYQTPEATVANARALLQAGAHGVKLEGGTSHRAQIEALVGEGIPVMGHIGMLPQSVLLEGGYRIKGKSDEASDTLLEDAQTLAQAGVFAMVLELVHPPTAKRITASVPVPTIGIGSGADCDGQVLVTQDLAGAFPWFRPKFVTPKAAVGDAIRSAAAQFAAETRRTEK
jgi:3-methyl-2-oxobutanoate hydroxymethyltransferase